MEKSLKILVSLFVWFGFWPLDTEGLVQVIFLHDLSWPLAPPLSHAHYLCPVLGSSEHITFRLLHQPPVVLLVSDHFCQSKLPEIPFSSCTHCSPPTSQALLKNLKRLYVGYSMKSNLHNLVLPTSLHLSATSSPTTSILHSSCVLT